MLHGQLAFVADSACDLALQLASSLLICNSAVFLGYRFRYGRSVVGYYYPAYTRLSSRRFGGSFRRPTCYTLLLLEQLLVRSMLVGGVKLLPDLVLFIIR